MAIDWSLAGQIGGVGFGYVFGLLLLLAIVIWLTGLIIKKFSASKDESGETKKGA